MPTRGLRVFYAAEGTPHTCFLTNSALLGFGTILDLFFRRQQPASPMHDGRCYITCHCDVVGM